MHKDKPVAQAPWARPGALRALRGLLADTVGEIETILATGDSVPRPVRGDAAWRPAHRPRIPGRHRGADRGLRRERHFVDNPLQRFNDVDVISGHVVATTSQSRSVTLGEDPADGDGVRWRACPALR